MAIVNAGWLRPYRNVLQWIAAAHSDLSGIAAILRDSAGAEVWTELPSDPSKFILAARYSLEGWRVHFGGQRTAMMALDSANGSDVQSYDPQVYTAMGLFIASIAALGPAFNAAISAHKTGGEVISQKLTQPERDALATAIEAQLA